MSDTERNELFSLRRITEDYLQQTQMQIVDYPATANDEDFQFIVRKVIYFQEMIDKINNDLTRAEHEDSTE